MTVSEVKAVARALGLPEELIEKPPIDGLCGKTDEANLGITYVVLDRYIRTGNIDDSDIEEKINKLHSMNAFEQKPMPRFLW